MLVSKFAASEIRSNLLSPAMTRRRGTAIARAALIETLENRQLLSATLTVVNPDGLPGTNNVVFNYIQNPDPTTPNVVHSQQTLQITDTGTSALTISSMTLSGPWAFVGAPSGGYTNVSVTPTTPLTITLAFTQRSLPAHSYNETNYTTNPNGGAAIGGTLSIESNDPVSPSYVLPLTGYWQNESNSNAEPNLQTVTNILAGYQTVINPTPVPDLTEPTGSTTAAKYYGSEVAANSWEAADATQAVSIQEIATYRTQGSMSTIYWYDAASTTSHQLYSIAGAQGQTLLPTQTTGAAAAATFTPPGAFGIRVDDEYSTDSLNSANSNPGGGGHHMRFFPLVNSSGTAVPNTYVVALDYGILQTENFDFNDHVFIVSNIRPSGTPATPTGFTATNAAQPVLSWNADTYSPVIYNVYRSTSASGPFALLTPTAGISTTTYTDTTAPAGAVYYQLTAEDSTQTVPTVSPPATAFINIGPVTLPQSISTYVNTPITFNPLAGATDPSGSLNPATIGVTAPTHRGTAVVNTSNETITYTPAASFTGTETFTYTVTDNAGRASIPETITATVLPVTLEPPVANNEVTTTLLNTPVAIPVLNVDNATTSFNVSSIKITTNPASGNVSVNTSTGVVTYTPGANFVGGDEFQYTVADNNGQTSNVGIVDINVGTVISSAKGSFKTLVYTDENGTPVTISINSGVADVYFDGTGTLVSSVKGKTTVAGMNLRARQITLNGTTAASVLSITGKKNGQVNLGGVSDTGPLRALSAPTANLSSVGSSSQLSSSGTLTGSLLVAAAVETATPIAAAGTVSLAGVKSISLRSANAAAITLGSTGVASTSVNIAGSVTDSSLVSTVPLSLLKSTSWINSNSVEQSYNVLVTAPSIANLTVGGEFDAALTLNSTGKAKALGSAHITGAVAVSNWNITGNTGAIFLGSAGGTWGGMAVTGNLASLTIAHTGLSADIKAGSINSLRVAGAITSDITTTGNLLSLQAAQLVGAIVDVGSTATSVSTATVGNIGTALLGNLHLTSRATNTFSDSSVIADRINSATTGQVNATNGGTPEGIAVVTFKGATVTVDGGVLHLSGKDLLSQSALATFLSSKDYTLGTFMIDIL